MRNVIYKYTLAGTHTKISVHKDYKVLDCKLQDELPVVWMEVDANNDKDYVQIHFILIATGQKAQQIFQDYNYTSTIQMDNGLVWHVYYKEIK